MVDPMLLRPAEAAERLGIGRSKVYELLASGELPSLKIGRLRRIPAFALGEWIARELTNSGRSLAARPGKVQLRANTSATHGSHGLYSFPR